MNFYKKNKFNKYATCSLVVLAFSLLFSACEPINNFEKNTTIPQYEWKTNNFVKGSFDITDTAARYNIYIVLRHTDAYRYNNIWLNAGIEQPGDSLKLQKVEILLGTDATGWLGTGMNDIWEKRQILNATPWHPQKTGTYNYTLQQIMRDDPLPHIMSAGLRVEKVM